MMGRRVAVVGGGLAGLAVAVALKQRGFRVELLEARRRLGGRASSFQQPQGGPLIDFCQHVSLGCCTNWWDFCQRAGIDDYFHRSRKLHFIGPGGERCDVGAAWGCPAPLHLATSLARLRYLTWRERWAIARGLWRLARSRTLREGTDPTMEQWLAEQRQPPKAVAWFWHVVLVSALGESLDRISLSAARKVFVDAFLSTPEASQLLIPTRPLSELYGLPLAAGLAGSGLTLRTGTRVAAVELRQGRAGGLVTAAGERLEADHIVVAVPWREAAPLLPPEVAAAVPCLDAASQLLGSGITGAHLWFDRPILDLPHAVLVGRTSQWVFSDPARLGPSCAPGPGRHDPQGGPLPVSNDAPSRHYVQVVISGSQGLVATVGQRLLNLIQADLQAVFPAAREAQLIQAQLVTERQAVFSPTPESRRQRPAQRTSVPGLYLAGDWTDTGWPATMEGAVRSGYLAAEAILASQSEGAQLLQPNLQPNWLVRGLFGPN